VTRLEAALEKLAVKATAGDTAAFRLLSTHMQAYQEPPESSPSSASELEAADQKVLSLIVRRFAGVRAGPEA